MIPTDPNPTGAGAAASAAPAATTPSATAPSKLGEYQIIAIWTPDQTFLATGGGGRQVVLKILERDCLLRGKLHPNIRDRLGRVCELAHTGVANLCGVERDGGRAFAVWEYVPGTPIDRHIAHLPDWQSLNALFGQTLLAVQSMHALGIVHGRIHAGNVIIDDLGRVHLTHVSPLLYDDPAADVHDLCEMINTLAATRGWTDTPPAQAAAELKDHPLADLLRRISLLAKPPEPKSPASAQDRQTHDHQTDDQQHRLPPRARLYWTAAVAAAVGLLLAAAIIAYAVRTAPRKPVPPQAPPEAFGARS